MEEKSGHSMETQKGGKHVRKSRRCGGQVRSSSIPLIDVLKEKDKEWGKGNIGRNYG